jgi:lipopolysaccharide/colanic/teichoic acid biosynthesis glycosyltransferase
MMALDLEYVERQSLRLDLSILARTIPAAVRAKGAA